jgi:hypothetical protein
LELLESETVALNDPPNLMGDGAGI